MGRTTTGFHHVALATGDIGRSLRFYRDLLGLRVVKKAVDPEAPEHLRVTLGNEAGAPGTRITLQEVPKEARRGRWGVGGLHHVALGVTDEATLFRWKRWLTDRGIPVSGPYNRGYFVSLYFQDPDGQILELATAGPGYTLDEPHDALGREVRIPPGAELRGERDEAEIRARTHPVPVEALEPGMALHGLHHLTGFTDDLAAAGDFYESVFGLRLVKKSVNQDDTTTRHYFWGVYDGREVAPHSVLTLFGWPRSDYRARDGAGQTRHIAFRARDDADLGAWREHILSLGHEATEPTDHVYYRAFELTAPDGQRIQVATDLPGYTVDEPEESLGAELKLPPGVDLPPAKLEALAARLEG